MVECNRVWRITSKGQYVVKNSTGLRVDSQSCYDHQGVEQVKGQNHTKEEIWGENINNDWKFFNCTPQVNRGILLLFDISVTYEAI